MHLTRFVPGAYKPLVARLLRFRNRHSCRPYCAEEFHGVGAGSELYCGDHTVQWRGGGQTGSVGEWQQVRSEPDHFVPRHFVSTVALCPLRKRVKFETLTTYYAESILGTDNLKEEKCTLVEMEFAHDCCPADLKGLVAALLSPQANVKGTEQQMKDKVRDIASNKELVINQVTPEQEQRERSSSRNHVTPIFVTNSVVSTPLGAAKSSAALKKFEMLGAELTLLRDCSKYPSCDGTACTIVEQLDECPRCAGGPENEEEDGSTVPTFHHSSGRNWMGCTFVYNSGTGPRCAESNHAYKDADRRLKIHQMVEVQAWLSESRVKSGYIGGIISVRADSVHLQLYATNTATQSEKCELDDEDVGDTSVRKSTVAVSDTGGHDITTVSRPPFTSAVGSMEILDFTVHLSVFEVYMNDDYDDEDDDGDEEYLMSWSKLTAESMKQLGRIELALHYKQVVLHLISFREQVQESVVSGLPDDVAKRNIGLIYKLDQSHVSRAPPSMVRHRDTSLKMYHQDLSRQVQFRSRVGEEKSQYNKPSCDYFRNENVLPRMCAEVLSTSRDGDGNFFTLIGDGSTRGVFHKDAMIMEYLPEVQIVKTILGDGSERVLSVPMLLQLATTQPVVRSDQASHAIVCPMMASVSRNLLKLLAFRRFAVLPEDKDRSQLFFKEKSTSVAVMIAQMRNTNYLNRNAMSKK